MTLWAQPEPDPAAQQRARELIDKLICTRCSWPVGYGCTCRRNPRDRRKNPTTDTPAPS